MMSHAPPADARALQPPPAYVVRREAENLRVPGPRHRLPAEWGQGPIGRLYQPAERSVPAVVQVHGGGWNNKDRTDGQQTAMDSSRGILVLSLEFRNALRRTRRRP